MRRSRFAGFASKVREPDETNAARMARRSISPGRSAAEKRREAHGRFDSNSASCWPRRATRIVSSPRRPSEFQLAARAAVTALAPDDGEQREEPKSFQAAYDLGKDALASYNAAKLALPTAENNNPEGVPELEAQMQQGKEDARHYFRLATTLIEDDTDLKLVNEVRYFLCWLYWEAGGLLSRGRAGRIPRAALSGSSRGELGRQIVDGLVRAALQRRGGGRRR